MKSRVAILTCIFALACMSIGCGATTSARSAANTNPSNPTGPTSPTNPSTPSNPTPPSSPNNPANPSDPSSPTDPSSPSSSDPATTNQLEITTTQLPDATSNSVYSAQLAASGGTTPYIWSASGTLPAGITMSSTGVISGTPTAAGQSMIAVNVKDSEQTPQTAQVTLALDVASGASTSTASNQSSSQYYGPGVNMIALNNFALDTAMEYVDYTFTAQQTGSIASLMPYFVDCKVETSNPCTTGAGLYGSGDGADLQINVYPDNGSGQPDMNAQPLGSITPFWVCGGGAITSACRTESNTFRTLNFERAVSVVAGTEYHIVFRNVAGSPASNFSSLDASLSPSSVTCPNVASPAQPTFAPSELGMLKSTDGGSTWGAASDNSCNTPIVDIAYSNGFDQGNGYTYVGDFTATIAGSSDMVRELFTVGGSSKTVAGASVLVNLVSGAEGLYAALETSAGTILAKGQAMPDSAPFSAWRTYKFSSPVTLQSGQTYQLVLTATGTYSAAALENGSRNGEPFSPDTVWSAVNAEAQFSTNGGDTWTEWEQGAGASEVADLMFYFTLQ
jgi:hypothetical protein